MRKVVVCLPTVTRPHPATIGALEDAIPAVVAAGWSAEMVSEIGCPYISSARATMLRKALDAKADVIVFLDHDVSFDPPDLLRLIETEGDVVCGTYRFKREPEEYMGVLVGDADGKPVVRADGCLQASAIPAGFLKVTKEAVDRFLAAYPQMAYGPRYAPYIDLFNHGAHQGTWYGEDYAFARNWRDAGGEIWVIPDINLHHHAADECFAGNLHRYLLRQPGGSDHPETVHG